jgi:hypothetical protein
VSEKPYRPNVGIALFNREGLVFDGWGFFPLSVLPKLVVPFRKPVYEKVAEAFAEFSAPR